MDLADWTKTDFPIFGLSHISIVSFDEDIQVPLMSAIGVISWVPQAVSFCDLICK
jgi:hypothetical protein